MKNRNLEQIKIGKAYEHQEMGMYSRVVGWVGPNSLAYELVSIKNKKIRRFPGSRQLTVVTNEEFSRRYTEIGK